MCRRRALFSVQTAPSCISMIHLRAVRPHFGFRQAKSDCVDDQGELIKAVALNHSAFVIDHQAVLFQTLFGKAKSDLEVTPPPPMTLLLSHFVMMDAAPSAFAFSAPILRRGG